MRKRVMYGYHDLRDSGTDALNLAPLLLTSKRHSAVQCVPEPGAYYSEILQDYEVPKFSHTRQETQQSIYCNRSARK